MLRIIALLLIANTASAQFTLSLKDRLKNNWPIYAGYFVAGAADGFEETIEHHYYIFRKKHPNANESFWNPEVSWENKWKEGNPEMGPAYFGSTNFLVWTTDAYHLVRLVKHTSYGTATVYGIHHGFTREVRPTAWDYILDFAIGVAFRTAGYYLVYGVIYK